jgi:phosphate-selective porin OprO and OprP
MFLPRQAHWAICALALTLVSWNKYEAVAQAVNSQVPLSIEERLAAQEAELCKLRQELAKQAELIQRLPPVTGVQQAVSLEAKDGASADSKPKESIEQRFSAFEKDWNAFKEKQKKEKEEAHGKPQVIVYGQVQGDFVSFNQDEVSRESVGDLQDGADFRRARLGARGRAFDVYEYTCQVDFALDGRPSFLDLYLEHRDLPYLKHVRVGHFFEPFSLERVTQNRNNTFMERSLVDTFAPARNMGVMTFGHTEDELNTWQIGTFRTNSDNNGNDSFDSGQALTMRGTWLPFWDEESGGRYYLHLGAAYSFRDAYRESVRFRQNPELRLEQPNSGGSNFAPIFVDTGFIPAHHFQIFDSEVAWIWGSFSVQSEFAFASVDQAGGPDLFFDAEMVQVSYFLTGEHRPYNRYMGIHDRLIPFTNFFRVRTQDQGIQMGCGAWEVAARYSWINLTNKNIQGNDLQDFTFGLNWYLNPYMRMKFNYVRAFLDDPTTGRSTTNLFGMRFDYDF